MVRDELLRLRVSAEAEAATLAVDLEALFAASRNSNADDEHDPEGATIGFERAQLTALLAAARERIAEIDDALRRLDSGTYGVCEKCGQPIADERLAARPFARRCITCA
ncbi:TraR/DksA family transcriptional regulator [Phytohabitans rumicis]|uniref:DnaK suppressor protein n=1 Tax=Phytohabitans rumicis TaxID=1076125 RepID=A0A6V8L0S6_9ACTN|nr:TraR/DksA C4-type zinc finger protein [Phytohabitans rumicis]GFJ87686.1 DnaK suppressor protein [Phytohabitans rumicis]